ncbi:hypothetical protein, partial [Streptomyces parvus]|uniref:hypothetical protein n=1 Tax=Streptomyces parvus TaxID=66428 RepID=UPI0033DA8866
MPPAQHSLMVRLPSATTDAALDAALAAAAGLWWPGVAYLMQIVMAVMMATFMFMMVPRAEVCAERI